MCPTDGTLDTLTLKTHHYLPLSTLCSLLGDIYSIPHPRPWKKVSVFLQRVTHQLRLEGKSPQGVVLNQDCSCHGVKDALKDKQQLAILSVPDLQAKIPFVGISMLHILFLESENEVIVGVYLIYFILVYKGGKKNIFAFGSQMIFLKISFLTPFYSIVLFFSIITSH